MQWLACLYWQSSMLDFMRRQPLGNDGGCEFSAVHPIYLILEHLEDSFFDTVFLVVVDAGAP